MGKGRQHYHQKHEAVAYLNRLGHLYYFTKSSFTKNFNPDLRHLIANNGRLINFKDEKKHCARSLMHQVRASMNIGLGSFTFPWCNK